MNNNFQSPQGSDPYHELNRAAEAGLCLVGARRQFRRLAREAMDAFAKADLDLRASTFPFDRPVIYRAFDAAHSAYAFFIEKTREEWDEEDGFPEYIGMTPPASKRRSCGPSRNRLDDILDGYIAPPEDPNCVEHIFSECARRQFDLDRALSKRLLCIALTWGVDLRHCHEEPGWARRQGVFPGAEAAPSLSCLCIQLSQTPHCDDMRAIALREAAMAAGRIQAAAYAYGRACCAEFEYATVIGGDSE